MGPLTVKVWLEKPSATDTFTELLPDEEEKCTWEGRAPRAMYGRAAKAGRAKRAAGAVLAALAALEHPADAEREKAVADMVAEVWRRAFPRWAGLDGDGAAAAADRTSLVALLLRSVARARNPENCRGRPRVQLRARLDIN